MMISDHYVYILSWKNYKHPQDANKPYPKNNLKGNRDNTNQDVDEPECGKADPDSADIKSHKFALIKRMLRLRQGVTEVGVKWMSNHGAPKLVREKKMYYYGYARKLVFIKQVAILLFL